MIELELRDDVAVLHMQRGSANALDVEFLAEIRRQVSEATPEATRGLILTSSGPIFCAGLDLPALVDYDRDRMRELLRELRGCCVDLFSHPRPTVAAMNGHAIAGGALLSLACDRRHVVMGQSRWGLNEAQLGLALPAFAIEMMRYALDRTTVEKLLYSGTLYPAFKAHDMGALDELVEEEDLLDSSLRAIQEWSASPEAFADIKRRLHAPVLEAIENKPEPEDEWIKLWFSSGVQARLREAVAQLRSKGNGEKAS